MGTMRHHTASNQLLALAWMGSVVAAALVGCTDDRHGSSPSLGPSTLVLRLPAALGELRRPAVPFDHGKHTAALGNDACEQCHSSEDGEMKFNSVIPTSSADEAMNAYHKRCITCHQERRSKGVTCGECHNHRPGSVSQRVALQFDYALHDRHNQAEDGKCETCHHVYDKKQGKLVYAIDRETACRNCHGNTDEGRSVSLRHAAHEACVGCHMAREAKEQPTGPLLCVGCHDAQRVKEHMAFSHDKAKPLPRLQRGQPDKRWIWAEKATAAIVPFDHEKHEGVTKKLFLLSPQDPARLQGLSHARGQLEGWFRAARAGLP